MLVGKCSFSIYFELVSAHCVIQLILPNAFFPFVKQKTFVSAMERLRQRRRNETKSNVNKIMRLYLVICMKKGVSSIDEKITRNDNNKLKSPIPLQRLIKLRCGPKF